ncbi:DUF2087 domain-containing protein [Micromonospora parva]|uniref:DUF2087 domain-containing protein n=1 Tax=Micromonospora parva TaxID=1464048 RepID=UPI0033FEFF6A
MTAHALAGALADDARRRIFAAIVLGATSATAVAQRVDLPARVVLTGVRRLTDAGLVAGADGALAVDGASLRAVVRDNRSPDDAEPAADDALKPWCAAGGSDHVTLRRYLIDEQLLTREHGIHQRL